MYSIRGYGDMIRDAVRMDAYERALAAVVKPGSVVVDIGTGTGIFALLACRLGARRVYAIEPGDAIHVGREIAAANGFGGTIEFIQDMSTEVTLPERADVIVSDMRGVLPFAERHLPAIADARLRFLAPGGTLIPRSDTLWVACVAAPEAFARIADPWAHNSYGLDMRAALAVVANQWDGTKVKASEIASVPALLGTLDYATVEQWDFTATVSTRATRATAGHGLCAWFDAALVEGIGFSNAPGRERSIYGHAFFPWPEPVELQAGDEIRVTLSADLVGSDYLWRWETRIADRAAFAQSSFLGAPLSPARLRKQAASHVAELNEEGRAAQAALRMMAEGTPLGEIAHELSRAFPQRFARWQDALTHVAELSSRYSR